ncbi:recombinase family protein [Streptomyces sioyaensis]|uniref:recombinase family protein n=1 Tax=Streptomyces sioyaensis TaxID=67364 RepID=UPI003D71D06D
MKPYVLDSYARESVERRKKNRRGERSLSIAGQHQVNLQRIEEYGATPGLLLEDPGKSAWDPKVTRPDWERVIERLETGESNGVVIFDIERFVRQMEDAVRIVKIAEKGFLIIDSDGEYNLTTPQGQKNFYEAAVSAQYYSHRLSTRVKRGYTLKIQDGEWRGGRYRMFGFEEDGTTVRQAEAEHIREAVRRLLAGRTPTSVVQWLDRIVGSTTAGNPWSHNSLRLLVTNPRLAGYIRRNGQIVGRLKGKPILEPTLWQAIVTYYESRSGRPATGAFLCTGIVVHADCGHTINGCKEAKGNRKEVRYYDDGTRRCKYICNRNVGGCGKTIGDMRALDRYIKAMVIDELSDPRHAIQVRLRAEADAQERAPIEAEIDRLRGLLVHWGLRLNAGKISPDYHDAMVNDVEAKIAAEETKLQGLGDAPPSPPGQFMKDALATWEAADGTERRELLKRAYAGHRILVVGGEVANEDFTQRIRVESIPRLVAL